MPYSDPDVNFDSRIKDIIKRCNYKSFLDIGAGSGKYGLLIRQTVDDAHIICIEAEYKYIVEFDLHAIYDAVHQAQVESFFDDKPDLSVELVIIGDCIEHLKKSDGVDLLHYLVYRTKTIIVVFPSKYVQYSWRGNPLEAHRSVWDETDFQQFSYEFEKKEFMNLAIVKGYLDDPETQFPKLK